MKPFVRKAQDGHETDRYLNTLKKKDKKDKTHIDGKKKQKLADRKKEKETSKEIQKKSYRKKQERQSSHERDAYPGK